jgi:hypothetical protein
MQRKLLAVLAAAIMAAPLGAQGDVSSSVTQPGSNPPGMISPGVPRDAATASDVTTGAIRNTNPDVSETWSSRRRHPLER